MYFKKCPSVPCGRGALIILYYYNICYIFIEHIVLCTWNTSRGLTCFLVCVILKEIHRKRGDGMETKRMQITVSDKNYIRLKVMATRYGVTANSLVTVIVGQWLDNTTEIEKLSRLQQTEAEGGLLAD